MCFLCFLQPNICFYEFFVWIVGGAHTERGEFHSRQCIFFVTTTWRPLMDHQQSPTPPFLREIAKVFIQREKSAIKAAGGVRETRKLLLKLIWHLSNMISYILMICDENLFSFRNIFRTKTWGEKWKAVQKVRASCQLTSKDDAHRLAILSRDGDCGVSGAAIGCQAGVFRLRRTHRSALGNCKKKRNDENWWHRSVHNVTGLSACGSATSKPSLRVGMKTN